MDELKELILERQKELREAEIEVFNDWQDKEKYKRNKAWIDWKLLDFKTRQNELSIVRELIKILGE